MKVISIYTISIPAYSNLVHIERLLLSGSFIVAFIYALVTDAQIPDPLSATSVQSEACAD